jgi:hypothetical protein
VVSTTSTSEPTTTITSEPTTTSTSVTTTTLQIASSVDCCQGAGQCAAGLGFSLDFNLSQWCSVQLPGSTGVHGGVCSLSGSCDVQPIDPPHDLCCQYNGASGPVCFDTAVPASTTADVWNFRHNCVGAYLGTAYYDAACSPAGTCAAP